MQSRPSIALRQSQHLALTPQLQLAIRLLQCSAQDLEQEIAQALLDNPLLERVEEYDTDEPPTEPEQAPEVEAETMSLGSGAEGPQDEDTERAQAGPGPSLQEHLLDQLSLTRATARDRALVTLLIDELDDNGYLATPLDEMHALLPPELEVDREELTAALRLLQSFDPPGVGASSLSECLLLQLPPHAEGIAPQVLDCARALAGEHLALLAGGQLDKLRQLLGCTQETLRQAHQLLLRLNPKPGRGWAVRTADYIHPEIIVRRRGRRWEACLNPAVMPRLRVNTAYEQAIRQQARRPAATAQPGKDTTAAGGASSQDSLQAQLQQAHGLVRSVSQRFDTILRVARAIVARQQAFFEQGVQAMRPLVLRDIGQELDLHESTVSRATRHKYAQTPWGVFELKYFFGSGLDAGDGDTVSATAVRALIQELVATEPPLNPWSDNRLVELLGERGVTIARRTVAKYREAAGIEPAAQRKARARLSQI